MIAPRALPLALRVRKIRPEHLGRQPSPDGCLLSPRIGTGRPAGDDDRIWRQAVHEAVNRLLVRALARADDGDVGDPSLPSNRAL